MQHPLIKAARGLMIGLCTTLWSACGDGTDGRSTRDGVDAAEADVRDSLGGDTSRDGVAPGEDTTLSDSAGLSDAMSDSGPADGTNSDASPGDGATGDSAPDGGPPDEDTSVSDTSRDVPLTDTTPTSDTTGDGATADSTPPDGAVSDAMDTFTGDSGPGPDPLPDHCRNDRQDGDEADIDCGGRCLPCGHGEPCADGPCLEGLACNPENDRCQSEPTQPCRETADCGPGLVCVDGQCQSDAGKDCVVATCDDGFVCEDGTCRANEGTACLDGQCAAGLACDASKICLPGLFLPCRPELGCSGGLVCDPRSLLCKRPFGGNCAAPLECLDGAQCDPVSRSCVLVTGPCNGTTCPSGYVCGGDSCLPGAGKPCFDGGVCGPGFVCANEGGLAVCRSAPGTLCTEAAGCTPGHVCDVSLSPARCVALEDEDCRQVPCAAGLVCDTDERCALPPGATGCTNDAQCAEGSRCEAGQCRSEGGRGCGISAPCLTGLSCEDGLCRAPDGETCRVDGECASSYCMGGLCAKMRCEEELLRGRQPYCETQQGVCEGLRKTAARCLGDGTWAACTTSDYAAWSAAYVSAPERDCDGEDGDCDGRVDEACVGVAWVAFASGGAVGASWFVIGEPLVGPPDMSYPAVEWGICALGEGP
jgi:hypothetical protein